MKNLRILPLLMVVILGFTSCNSNAQTSKKTPKSTAKTTQSDVVSVSYKHTAGRGGFSNIVVTKDLVTSEAAGGMFSSYPKINRKTTTSEWNNLISSINVASLEKIKNGAPQGHYDGPDEFITVKTKTKEINILNASSPELTAIKNQLNKMVGARK